MAITFSDVATARGLALFARWVARSPRQNASSIWWWECVTYLIYKAYAGQQDPDKFLSLCTIDDPYYKLHLAYILYLLNDISWADIICGLSDVILPEYIEFMGEFNIHREHIKSGQEVMDFIFSWVKDLNAKETADKRIKAFLQYRGTSIEHLFEVFKIGLVSPEQITPEEIAAINKGMELLANVILMNVRPALQHLMKGAYVIGGKDFVILMNILKASYGQTPAKLTKVLTDSLIFEASQATGVPVQKISDMIFDVPTSLSRREEFC